MRVIFSLFLLVCALNACSSGTCQPPKMEKHDCGSMSDCKCSSGHDHKDGGSCGS